MRERLFSVSVDLDGLGCYAAIHGLSPGALGERALAAVPVVAVERLGALFAAQGIRATFFAIGRELELPGAPAAIARACAAGHEIASHSYAHDYALSRRPQAEIEDDLRRAELALSRATGQSPRGFRAPGYTLSRALLDAVRARGYLYDSSLLPSPPYAAVKAAAMGLYALRGRPSGSILGAPRQLFRPRGAHRWRGVRELPVSVLPWVRGPVIGTVLLGVPDGAARLLARLAFASGPGGARHLNLELHGVDALDQSDGVPEAIARAQPGLRVPAAEKLRRLGALVGALKARAEALTLEQAAARLLP